MSQVPNISEGKKIVGTTNADGTKEYKVRTDPYYGCCAVTASFGPRSRESQLLFDHAAAQTHFGCSVFWLRRLAAFGGEDATVEYWQIKRDGTKRGLIEIWAE